jgi:predicted O-methyltransferase YrrM
MSNRSQLNLASLYDYLFDVSVRDTPLLKALRDETAQDPMARMQIAPEQGQFMALLVKLTGARSIIEIGTFTGYSSLCMAQALPDNGRLICCDVSEEWTAMARSYWEKAGVAHKIDLRIAPALDTLRLLLDNGQGESFDMAFVDADKANYRAYYECCLSLLKPGGLILLDNTLWSGRVADESVTDEDTLALRAFNASLKDDMRIDFSLLPMADGLTLVRKR